MSLLAILTGLYRLNTLLPHGRAHSIAHHHYTMVFESSSLLQHLLHFNCWLKWWLFTNCCWSPEKTVFILFMNTHDRLLLPPSLSDFQRSCQSFLQPWFGTNTYIPHCMERWVYFAIFFVTLPQISSTKNRASKINFYQFVFKRTVNPSLPHSTGWYFYNVCINMWFQWDDFTLLFLLC